MDAVASKKLPRLFSCSALLPSSSASLTRFCYFGALTIQKTAWIQIHEMIYYYPLSFSWAFMEFSASCRSVSALRCSLTTFPRNNSVHDASALRIMYQFPITLLSKLDTRIGSPTNIRIVILRGRKYSVYMDSSKRTTHCMHLQYVALDSVDEDSLRSIFGRWTEIHLRKGVHYK